MKRFLFILTIAALMSSCAPSRYVVHVEMCRASKSGLNLMGKTISTVYYKGDDLIENRLIDSLAMGFTRSLENDYQTGKGSVLSVSLDRSSGDYTSRDSLINLLGRYGGDVVLLFDVTFSNDMRQLNLMMYCYDGMNKADVVKKYMGNSHLQFSSEEEMLADALTTGRYISESFKIQWNHEQYSITYYDAPKWLEALYKAEQFDWKGAMDIWLGLLDSEDPLKRASAEYNIAVACYMLGDFDLAKMWLDRSDAECRMPSLTDTMRKYLMKN